ncbi:MAG: sigma-70 family RNA polymerase sigma factor [Chloroflexi bacterium]|nr:sigma-70 family RNA polymerase sigma factor [Chloroflexota bacterium]
MDEAELVRRCQAGGEEAYGLLLERYGKLLLGTAYLMTRDRGLAEDVVQEALVSAWRGLPSFQPTGSFKAWLVRILINEARQQARRKRVQTAPLEDAALVAGDPHEVEDTVLRDEEQQSLQRALETLQEDHREVLVLRYYADLTVPQIARAIGSREGTVKSRLHRAVERLRLALARAEEQAGLGREG